jgi:hypothetical protein
MIFNFRQWLTRGEERKSLAERCVIYLRNGPPPEMTNYVPGSMTEMIISQGASGKTLDPELKELAGFVLDELAYLDRYENPKVRAYVAEAAELVREIVRQP